MALASTSRVQLRYIKEVTFGTTPGSGNSTELKMIGESLNYTINKEISEEINNNRAASSMIAVSAECSGGVQFELSFKEYDEFIRAALQASAWTAYGTLGVGTAFGGTYATGTITAGVAPTGSSAFTTLRLGQWFTITGSTVTANNNKLFRVSKTVAPTSTVITLDAGTPASAGADTGTPSIVKTAYLANGTTQDSFSLEKQSGDTGEFFTYKGMTISAMSMNMASGSRTTGEFSFMGKVATQQNTTAMPGTPVASSAYQIMSGVSGTSCALWYNGSPITGTFINSIALSYDNSLRMQNALCSLGAVGIGSGNINVTADMEVYFATGATFYSQFLANTNAELAFTTFDVDGNGYVWTLPLANISSYTITAGGKDQDLMAQISVTGLLDQANATPALRKVMFVDRMGAALT